MGSSYGAKSILSVSVFVDVGFECSICYYLISDCISDTMNSVGLF